MKVSEVMSKKVVRVGPATMLPEVAETMTRENIGVLPVEEAGKLVGIVTDRDIVMRAVAKKSIDRPVKDVMTSKPVTISPDASIDSAIQTMVGNKVRRLIVMNDGHVVGLVSLEDLLEGGNPKEFLRAVEGFHKQTRHA